ncbi:hypothetical protein RJD24_08180 [Bacillaceae bacterium IKA-2]|nr:hypothetical protein RJD24_08180 [Bacillaceae bacterium IKA-2]
MRELWNKFELLLVNSHLRLPLYIITIFTGVGFFIAPVIFSPTVFVTFLGLITIFESIIPTGYHQLYFKNLTSYFPIKIQRITFVILKISGIVLGLFLIFIGIGVEISRFFR